MTPSRPYLIRALYEWIADNQMTPHITVNAESEGVSVPPKFVVDGQITLNISGTAVKNLRVGNDAVECQARFSGKIFPIYAPIDSIQSIFARESGQGMVFTDEDGGGGTPPPEPPKSPPSGEKASKKKKKSHLKLVKG